MNKFFTYGIFILLSLTLSLQGSEQGYIEWKPIKGAFGYKLEIRDESKKLIIEEVVNSTRYLIRTPSGKFEFRISPMNVFEKTTVWSYWNPLNVVISKRPSINTNELSLDISELSKPITFKGKNFLSETKLKFIWGSRVISAKSITINDTTTLTAILNPEGAAQGKYELHMENPGNRILSIKNFLTLSDNNEADRLAREKAERERLEAERLAREKEEAERLARENERLEAERLAREKAERERLEAERLSKLSEKERLEAERLAREKAERERLEAERLAKEKAERERLEAERLAREKAERERLEAERLAKMSEKDRLEALAREKAERERLEAERLAREKAEQERLEKERLSRDKAERDRLEKERLAREKAERERLERERLAREGMKDTRQRVIDGIEDSTNREYLKIGSYELDLILDDFKKSCSPSNLLETLVEKCFSNHTVLKLGTIQKSDISNYLLMSSDNYKTRLRSYLYFMRENTPQMKAALDKLSYKLEKSSGLDIEEKEFIQKAISYQRVAK